MVDRKIFSERLLFLRQRYGLTQAQLGAELGTKKQSVNNWEKCVSLPSLDLTASLADYFNVSLDYLCGRSDNPERSL